MIPFQCFIDHVIDLTLLVDILLCGFLGENVIEIEIFRCLSVIDFNLFAGRVAADTRISVTSFKFMLQEGSDADCGLYFTAH